MKTAFLGNSKKLSKGITIALWVSAALRILLQAGLPIYMRANYDVDDELYVTIASRILKNGWFGPYDSYTLNKVPSFAFFLALIKSVNLPYMMALGLLYTIASVIFFFAIRRVIKRDWLAFICYVYMLFSPIMYDYHMSQVYRNSIIPAFVLIIISCYMVMFLDRQRPLRRYALWSFGCGLAFAFFWLIREDSIWLGCFVFGATVLTVGMLLIERKRFGFSFKRLLCIFLPVIMCITYVNGVKLINYSVYGVYVVTDFDETYAAEVWSLIKTINNEDGSTISAGIQRDTVDKLYEASPTFARLQPALDALLYSYWSASGTMTSAVFLWRVRWSLRQMGLYTNAVETNQFYKAIYEELSAAIESGELSAGDSGIQVSAVSGELDSSNLDKIISFALDGAYKSALYSMIDIELVAVSGTRSQVQKMEWITSTNAIVQEVSYKFSGWGFVYDPDSTLKIVIVDEDGEATELAFTESDDIYAVYPDYEQARQCRFSYISDGINPTIMIYINDELEYKNLMSEFMGYSTATCKIYLDNNAVIDGVEASSELTAYMGIAQKITSIYSATGWPLCVLALSCYLLLLLANILLLIRRRKTGFSLWLIETGLLMTIAVDLFGVSMNYGVGKNYDALLRYTSGIYAIWHMFVCLSIIFGVQSIRALFAKRPSETEEGN